MDGIYRECRHRMLKTPSLILTLTLTLFFLCLLLATPGRGETYRGELDGLAQEFYAHGMVDQILQELSRREAYTLEEEEGYSSYVTLAEIELFRGEVKKIAGLEDPDDHFHRAYELSERALQEMRTGPAKRISAEALIHLFDYRSTLFTLRNYRQVLHLLERADEINPGDPMTHLIYGLYSTKAPRIGGGDKEKGIEMLEGLLEEDYPLYSFIVLNLLAHLDMAENNEPKAHKRLDEALLIYPHSPWIGELF